MSEAGTPAISDPGYRIVSAALAAGFSVTSLPGPVAAVTALVASGLPTDRFFFGGFLPRKSGARRQALEELTALKATLIFYESPKRTHQTLVDMHDTLGDRQACVARELTKTHEEYVRGPLSELARRFEEARPLGEITLLVAGRDNHTVKEEDLDALWSDAKARLTEGASVRDLADEVAARTGLKRRAVYQKLLNL